MKSGRIDSGADWRLPTLRFRVVPARMSHLESLVLCREAQVSTLQSLFGEVLWSDRFPIPESSASWVRCGVVCGWRDARPSSLTQRNFSVRFRDCRGRAGCSPGPCLRGPFNGAVLCRLCEPMAGCYCTSFMEEVCLQSVYKVQIHPLAGRYRLSQIQRGGWLQDHLG